MGDAGGAEYLGWHQPSPFPPFLVALLWINLVAFVWRAIFRVGFVWHVYGPREALWAFPRMPFANVIAIMAGRRATAAYLRTLLGNAPVWEKTPHTIHASVMLGTAARA